MRVLGSILVYFFMMNVYAGGAPVVLECVSNSKKTKVYANFPGDILGVYIDFEIEGEEFGMLDEDYAQNNGLSKDLATGHTFEVTDYKYSVKLKATDKHGEVVFKLDSIRSSFKYIKTDFGFRKKFQAQVKGLDPRENKEGDSPLIYVNCTYIYEI